MPMSMTATEQMTPPATYALHASDRQRLVRSIRKIRSVLGEEPVVELESSNSIPAVPPLPKARLGLGMLYSQASASLSSLSLPLQKPDVTTASLAAHTDEKDKERPSLVLRLPAFEPLDLATDVTSPARFSSSFPPSEQEQRRLRLAKVSRTLGESIPPSLIFTPSHPDIKRRRRASSLITPESALEQRLFLASRELGQTVRRVGSVASFTDMSDPQPDMPAPEDSDSSPPISAVHVHPVFGSSMTEDGLLSTATGTDAGDRDAPPRRTSRESRRSSSNSYRRGPPTSPSLYTAPVCALISCGIPSSLPRPRPARALLLPTTAGPLPRTLSIPAFHLPRSITHGRPPGSKRLGGIRQLRSTQRAAPAT
ncbi:hypothetical protein MKEN_01000500 [Mycena kentingensis (nom. inval.)]|nr:hypothetical protein MKEN_01000500 [Mycena kentingensis (nom. inval.)]